MHWRMETRRKKILASLYFGLNTSHKYNGMQLRRLYRVVRIALVPYTVFASRSPQITSKWVKANTSTVLGYVVDDIGNCADGILWYRFPGMTNPQISQDREYPQCFVSTQNILFESIIRYICLWASHTSNNRNMIYNKQQLTLSRLRIPSIDYRIKIVTVLRKNAIHFRRR